MSTWQPSATIETLKQRAIFMQRIRAFFAEREVLEVETPTLSHATVTDPHLHTFQSQFSGADPVYLMTSPEFHMKRLLAAGSGCIYQLSKAFRNEEQGRYHNPEFTMLEWYRVGFDHHDLMAEMDSFLQTTLNCAPCEKITYQDAFQTHLGLCPLDASLTELQALACDKGYAEIAQDETNKDTLLQLLFSFEVEPHIGQNVPVMVYDFPASQAALAKINAKDPRVADRFEVYFKGVELANGFHELQQADEQLQRFEQDNQQRQAMKLASSPIDHHLLEALQAGLPACAGVALGVDRLFMLAQQAEHIDEVLAFPFVRA